MEELKDKKAVFLDNRGELQTAVIYFVPGQLISIKTFDQKENETGYMNLYFHRNNRFF